MSAPICQRHGCGRRATFAAILPDEVHPRYVKLACSRHYRGGYQVSLPEVDSILAHLLNIDAKRRAGAMLQAALRREDT